jgi:hypothetical protein
MEQGCSKRQAFETRACKEESERPPTNDTTTNYGEKKASSRLQIHRRVRALLLMLSSGKAGPTSTSWPLTFGASDLRRVLESHSRRVAAPHTASVKGPIRFIFFSILASFPPLCNTSCVTFYFGYFGVCHNLIEQTLRREGLGLGSCQLS